MIDVTRKQRERYSRHILLRDIGIEGQGRIMESSVLVIGAGGLGSPVAYYLAAAGVGRLGLADGDTVELSNLQRQILHTTPDIGRPKVESAAEKLRRLNPDTLVEPIHERLGVDTIRETIRRYDFVVECTDSFASKFLVNDACVMERKPFSHGGVLQLIGQTMTVVPGASACYRCVFDSPPPPGAVPSTADVGVLGALAGMLGTIQAAEALKFVSGAGTLLRDALLSVDVSVMDFRKVTVCRRESCPVCGVAASITTLQTTEKSLDAPREYS